MKEIGAAIGSGAFVYLAMQAKKNSELKVEIFTRLNRLEQTTARLEERCPMKNTR